MLKNPCKPDCPKRHGGCHADCPDHLAYEILKDIEYEQKQKERQLRNDLYSCSRFYRDKRKKRPYMDRRDSQ